MQVGHAPITAHDGINPTMTDFLLQRQRPLDISQRLLAIAKDMIQDRSLNSLLSNKVIHLLERLLRNKEVWDDFLDGRSVSDLFPADAQSELWPKVCAKWQRSLDRARFFIFSRLVEEDMLASRSDIQFRKSIADSTSDAVLKNQNNPENYLEERRSFREAQDEDYNDDESMSTDDDNSYADPSMPDPDMTLRDDEMKECQDTHYDGIDETILQQSCLSLYPTLEFDQNIVSEQDALESADKADEVSSIPWDKLQDYSIESNEPSLKYLTLAVKAKRNLLSLPDTEMNLLFSEVRRNNSKWVNDDRIGQGELYEACEKVVLQLRSYTEHSTAFLTKVSKREAPDYHLVIKYPMDLGTVMKKLKNLEYNSKKEFVDDLMLIWSNCLTYNANPNHFLRRHALAMEKKTLSLIPSIPNIEIKDRKKIEVEDTGNDVEEIDEEMEQPHLPRSRSNSYSLDGRLNNQKNDSDIGSPVPFPKNENTDNKSVTEKIEPSIDEMGISHEHTPNSLTSRSVTDATEGRVSDDDDFESQYWKEKTKLDRAQILRRRRKLIQKSSLNGEETAFVRKSDSMNLFRLLETKSSKDLTEIERFSLMTIFYDPLSGIVPIEPVPATLTKVWVPEASVSHSVTSKMYPITSQIIENCKNLHAIRENCRKITIVKQLSTNHIPHPLKKVASFNISLTDIYDYDNPDLSGHGTAKLCQGLLYRCSGLLLYHAGFEYFERLSVETFTEIAANILNKLGRSMQVFLEANSRLGYSDVLEQTLYESGIKGVNELEKYRSIGIYKYGLRILESRNRLDRFLSDLLRPARKKDMSDEALIFENGMDDIALAGELSAQLGEDFFGLKSLGLAEEFGINAINLPISLLQGTLRSSLMNGKDIVGAKDKEKSLERLAPISAEDIEKQINVVQPILMVLLNNADGSMLTDDYDSAKRARPKMLPNGRIPVQNIKRVGGSAPPVSKKKKKIRTEDTE